MAGYDRGTFFLPDVDDEVLVGFEAGDPARPFIIGSLWNGNDTPPMSMAAAGNNAIKAIVSRNGVRIEMSDENGKETCTISTPGGHSICVTDANSDSICLKAQGGCSLTLKSDGTLLIQSAKKMTLSGESVEIHAGSTKVHSGSAVFSGTIQCDTLRAKNVIGETYAPGAGNIW